MIKLKIKSHHTTLHSPGLQHKKSATLPAEALMFTAADRNRKSEIGLRELFCPKVRLPSVRAARRHCRCLAFRLSYFLLCRFSVYTFFMRKPCSILVQDFHVKQNIRIQVKYPVQRQTQNHVMFRRSSKLAVDGLLKASCIFGFAGRFGNECGERSVVLF